MKFRNILRKKKVRLFLKIGLGIFLFYILFLNHIEITQVGIARNWFSGETYLQEQPGWYLTPPWVWVARVGTHPIRVGVPTAGRGYSAKLVKFETEYWEEFVEVEGWRYYWLDNRLSFNLGNDEEYRGFRNLMLGYAYSVKEYPFISILDEYKTE